MRHMYLLDTEQDKTIVQHGDKMTVVQWENYK